MLFSKFSYLNSDRKLCCDVLRCCPGLFLSQSYFPRVWIPIPLAWKDGPQPRYLDNASLIRSESLFKVLVLTFYSPAIPLRRVRNTRRFSALCLKKEPGDIILIWSPTLQLDWTHFLAWPLKFWLMQRHDMSAGQHPLASILSTAKHFSAQEGKAAETASPRKAVMMNRLKNCMLLVWVGMRGFGYSFVVS